jgi:predicted phage terminase large subunit-like protein
MSAALSDCLFGKTRRLIITLPPRHLKSLLASVALPAFWLGHYPDAQIICVSYGQNLAEKLANDCRSIMASRFYQRTFSTRLSPRRQTAREFTTTAGGFRFATSIGGPLTGRGADLIVIDDPLKAEEAFSEAKRNFVNTSFDQTLLSRLNNKESGCVIIAAQRLHEHDLVGHVLGRECWQELSLPAIAEQDETHTIKSLHGEVRFHRKKGEALHPERESCETLDRLRRSVGEDVFAAQYQQAPLALSGGLIKEAWLIRCSANQIPSTFDEIVQSWDTGSKLGPDCSYSVCTTWGLLGGHCYLLDVLRQRLDCRALKRAARSHADAFSATVILIEDKASGVQLIQVLWADGVRGITPCQPQGDKTTRMQGQAHVFEAGLVHVRSDAAWSPEYVQEIIGYPATLFDDQVDSTSQFLEWWKRRTHRSRYQGLYDYYAQEAAKVKSMSSFGSPAMPALKNYVPFKVNPGNWAITTLRPDGRTYFPDKNGIIWVAPEDAVSISFMGSVTRL